MRNIVEANMGLNGLEQAKDNISICTYNRLFWLKSLQSRTRWSNKNQIQIVVSTDDVETRYI